MEQVLYQLPDGWSWKTLGDVCIKVTDGSHNPPKGVEVGFPMLSSRNVMDNGLVWDNFRLIPEDAFESEHKRTRISEGDVLLTIVGTIGRSCVVRGLDKLFTLQRSVAVLSTEELIPEFLSYQFKAPFIQEHFISNAKGSAQKGIYLKQLKTTNLACPPKEEQKRIVEKLDALLTRIDTAIGHLQECVILSDTLFSSALNRVFNPSAAKENLNSGYALPKEWDWKAVKDLSKKIQYGHTAKAAEKGNAQFLRITDIQENNIDWAGVPYVELSDKNIEKYGLSKNDLVFARSGATAGKSILIKEPPENAIFASYLIRIIPAPDLIQPEYLELFFRSPAYWGVVKENASGAAQPNINGSKLGEFKVPTPRLETQKRIVDEMSKLSARVTELKKELRNKISFFESERLSILDGAFKGDL